MLAATVGRALFGNFCTYGGNKKQWRKEQKEMVMSSRGNMYKGRGS